MRLTLQRGTDQVVRLPRVRTTASPVEYLNTATVTGTLCDGTGTLIRRDNWTYVPSSDGVYEWVINGPTLMQPASTRYHLEVVGQQDDWNLRQVYDVTLRD
ncbi:MAG: hypothetical protein C5B54_05090 [Acidobacteria bacterium]|nr:MAG: hypothetical protein C5B54_05090 [Acidobacteriota bacterium]